VGLRRITRLATLTVATALLAGLTGSTGYAGPTPVTPDRQLASDRQQLEAIVERYDAARDRWRATNAQLALVNAQLAPLRAAVDAAQADIGQEASALYRGGAIGSFATVVSSRSPEDLMDQLAVLDHIDRQRHRKLARLLADRDQVDRQSRALAALSARHNAESADLAAQKSAILADISRLRPGHTTGGGPVVRSPAAALSDGFVPPSGNDPASQAVRFAFSQLGKTYRFAAEGPNSYDCSGLTMAAWKAAGVALPHNAAQQHKTVHPITRAELRPGDLVFYFQDIHHVALYVGNGQVIEAPTEGERISMRAMDFAPISGYGRVE
jgi:cell wall-associated NlpC family hydrolase